MHRSHLLRWLALSVAVLSFQCLQSLSDDCTKTRTCEPAPQLGPDCRWYYPDGGIWEEGPRQKDGLWVWPNGKRVDTQGLVCTPVGGDAGLGPIGVGPCRSGDQACDPGTTCDEASQRCVRCLDSSQCTDVSDSRGALPACDPRIRDCVACLEDADCANNSGGPHCKRDEVDPRNNRCVECANGKQCDLAAGEFCDSVTDSCTTVCSGPGECKGIKSICSGAPDGRCVQCLENSQCSGATPQCNTARKECVPCVDDSVCGGLACSAANRCVDCVDDTKCAAGTHCDTTTNKCVTCVTDSQCTAPEASRCNAQHQCVPCTDSSQCEGARPLCDTTRGLCVECVDNAACGNRACDTAKGECVGCVDSDDCNKDPTLARCDTTTQQCVPCTSTSQCTGKFPGNKNICRTPNTTGECVECQGNGDCAADPARSKCNPSTGVCGGCTGDGDCASVNGKHACLVAEARCVECTSAAQCTTNPNGPACNTATNTCVQCVVDGDCHSPDASRCVNNQCVACVNDAGGSHCGHVLNGSTVLGVCDTSGAAGVCVQCTGANRTACGANVCNSLTKVCSPFAVGSAGVCQDCVSDAHCAPTDRCVLETFAGTSLGYSCFHVRQGATCPSPYAQASTATTIDGQSETVCSLRSSTCSALNQMFTPCTGDAECGEANLDDGRCSTSMCSLPCTSGIDCPSGSPTACEDGVCLL
jgi:hypothetical protein